ncbi:MAG: sigma-70 family RNA polymerase sigma factor [Anaerolineales bacterium]|nr:sigma-70 family RNA polymerase sigma factor [Anaerolineales bacterium]
MNADENAPVSDKLAVRAANDPAAFGALFDCFYGRVFNYARYRCDDDDTADDLTARIFERVLTNIRQYAPEKGPFAPWLFALARNVINDHYRAAHRFRWLTLEALRGVSAPEPGPEAALLACEDERELLTALAGLDARERDILGLKFAARLTNREIARNLGLREGHVGVIVYRALGKLRMALGKGGGG